MKKTKRGEENLVSIEEEEIISKEEREGFKERITTPKKMERAKVLKMSPAVEVLSKEGCLITIEEVGMVEEGEAMCLLGNASPATR